MKPRSARGLIACVGIGLATLVGVAAVVAWGGGGVRSGATSASGISPPDGSSSAVGPSALDSGATSSSRSSAAVAPGTGVPLAPGTAAVSGADLKASFPVPSGATELVPSGALPGAQAWRTTLDPDSVESFYRSALSARNYKLDYSSLQPDVPDGVSSTIYVVKDLANNQVGLITVANNGPGTPTAIEWEPT